MCVKFIAKVNSNDYNIDEIIHILLNEFESHL